LPNLAHQSEFFGGQKIFSKSKAIFIVPGDLCDLFHFKAIAKLRTRDYRCELSAGQGKVPDKLSGI
jgi:hypothetical protein